jgi:hypothetical protein
MTGRIFLFSAFAFALATGCESYATRTRATPSGGAYLLTLANSGQMAVQSASRDVIQDMQAQCHGDYEVTAIEAVPLDKKSDSNYLDASYKVASGPYQTQISYECRTPIKADLNHQLYVLAGPTLKIQGHGEGLARGSEQTECFEQFDCPAGTLCEPKPCAK